VPYLAVMSSIESLHRMTREERNIDELVVPGSDHLTSYNLYAEAFQRAGYVGEVYGLPRHLFDPEAIAAWAEERGVLVKAIEDAALATSSVFRGVGLPLPLQMPLADGTIFRRFTDLVAQYMPFDLVIDEETADGQQARVSKTSVCGSWGAVAGSLRYFADRHGVPRASIEGTQIPLDRIRRHARRVASDLVYDARSKGSPLMLRRHVEYFGFVLERHSEPLKQFPSELADRARQALAEALARSEADHMSQMKNRAAIEEVREMYRRSGGQTPRLSLAELTAHFKQQLDAQDVNSLQAFRNARLAVRVDDFVPKKVRAQLQALPSTLSVHGHEVEVHYDVEEQAAPVPESSALASDIESSPPPAPQCVGVARLRLPEKLARSITEDELPPFDRPLRFIVTRGQRGAVRAKTLEELQELLEGPWLPNAATPGGGSFNEAGRNEARHGREAGARGERSQARPRKNCGGPRSGARGGTGGPRRSGGPPRKGRRR
jgi:hypothetical protein